jgi:hypothetical protein
MTDHKQIVDAAFEAWQDVNQAQFYLLMGFKHGAADHLATARAKLAAAVEIIDRAAAKVVASDEDDETDREPEPPTFDEALAAKCDAEARMDEARALKGMV